MKIQRGWRRLLAMVLVALLAGCGGGAVSEGALSPKVEARAQQPKTVAQKFAGNGTYWNPQAPGTGFVFEAQASSGVAAFFVFDTNGKPVWYMASGAFTQKAGGGYGFAGVLQRYSGGQAATSTVPKVPVASTVGPVSIDFSGDNASVQVPGRSYTAQRFNASGKGSPATATQPITGIYWNDGESGRGYTIEVRDNTMMVGVFHYDAEGAPTWNLVVGNIGIEGTVDADFNGYVGGQTLSGPYVPPQGPLSGGLFRAKFAHPCKGVISLPGMHFASVTRFPFGGLSMDDECRVISDADDSNPTTALKCPNSTLFAGPVAANAATQVQSDKVSLTFKTPASGMLNLRVCAIKYLPGFALAPSLLQFLNGDPAPYLRAAVLADGEFDALVDKEVSFSILFVENDPMVDMMHMAAYTQDAGGVWSRTILPTTRTPGPSMEVPNETFRFQEVRFKAPISKTGFYGLIGMQGP